MPGNKRKRIEINDDSDDQSAVSTCSSQSERMRLSARLRENNTRLRNGPEQTDVTMEEILRTITGIKKNIHEMNRKIDSIMENQKKSQENAMKEQPDLINRYDSKQAKKQIEEKVVSKLFKRREDTLWKKSIASFKIPGLDESKLSAIKDILSDLPTCPTSLPRQIANLIWEKSYMERRLLGPILRNAHGNEKNLYIDQTEEQKLRDILNFITPVYTDKTVWRVLVRDPINQYMRNEKYKKTLVEKLTTCMEEPNLDQTPTSSPTRSDYSYTESQNHKSKKGRENSYERNTNERNDRNMHDNYNDRREKRRTGYNDSSRSQRRRNY